VARPRPSGVACLAARPARGCGLAGVRRQHRGASCATISIGASMSNLGACTSRQPASRRVVGGPEVAHEGVEQRVRCVKRFRWSVVVWWGLRGLEPLTSSLPGRSCSPASERIGLGPYGQVLQQHRVAGRQTLHPLAATSAEIDDRVPARPVHDAPIPAAQLPLPELFDRRLLHALGPQRSGCRIDRVARRQAEPPATSTPACPRTAARRARHQRSQERDSAAASSPGAPAPCCRRDDAGSDVSPTSDDEWAGTAG
jgi:hypothetical protein